MKGNKSSINTTICVFKATVSHRLMEWNRTGSIKISPNTYENLVYDKLVLPLREGKWIMQ